MSVKVQTVTAPDLRELDRLVQLAIAQGWQPIGNAASLLVGGNGEKGRAAWQQPMRRK
jgi:hypothetical protein